LSIPQKEYIKEQIKDLEFTEVQKGTIFEIFDKISSHLSKTLPLGNKSSTVLKEFFTPLHISNRRLNPNILQLYT
jgi:hypothetical protein